jgi:TrmH family RNA methyltransferase
MPRTLPVESRNQWFQRVEALKRNRNKRHREGLFVVEGVRPINSLVGASSWEIEAFLYAPERDLSDWARTLLDKSRAVVHLEVGATLLDELSDKDDSSEMLAVARIPPTDLGDLPKAQGPPLYVLLDQPNLPGNLGTMIRTCDAMGATGLVLFGHAADPFDPQAVRASTGSLFSQPLARVANWEELDAWLGQLRAEHPDLAILRTSAHGDGWPDETDLTGPTVLMFGNETSGLSHRLGEACHGHLSIPMQGTASSLNVAAAATAVLYEAARQRRGSGGPS